MPHGEGSAPTTLHVGWIAYGDTGRVSVSARTAAALDAAKRDCSAYRLSEFATQLIDPITTGPVWRTS